MSDYEDEPTIEKRPSVAWQWLKRIAKIALLAVFILFCRTAYHHYEVTKKLDEALAELDRTDPGWRLEEIEAAREQIPEERNSARVVMAAAGLLPKKWPSDHFNQTYVPPRPEETLDRENLALILEELKVVQPALEEARKLAGIPKGRHRISYQPLAYETLLTDQMEVRRVQTLLMLDLMRCEHQRSLSIQVMDLRALLNAARSIGDEPTLVSQLIRTAGILNTNDFLTRSLAHGELADRDLAWFQIESEKEDSFSELEVTARGERASLNQTFDSLESEKVSLGQLSKEIRDKNDFPIEWFGREKFRESHPAMLGWMNRIVTLSRLPMPQQEAAEETFDSEIHKARFSEPLAVLFIPAYLKFSECGRRKHAHLRCSNVALAVERYRMATHQWPDSLDQLCPKYLSHIPLDPYNDKPLRLRRLSDGLVIYSVGHDGIDDEGHFDYEHPDSPGVDLGERLWDVNKRNRPPRSKPAKDELDRARNPG